MSPSVRRCRSIWTSPDATRTIEWTLVGTKEDLESSLVLRDGWENELLRLSGKRVGVLPGRAGRVFLTWEEGALRIRDTTSSGVSLRVLEFPFERYVLGPKDRYLLTCGARKSYLLDLQSWGAGAQQDACEGAFGPKGERIVYLLRDRKRLLMHHMAVPEFDWQVDLGSELQAPAFFSVCGEFVGVREQSQSDQPTRAFNAGTGAEVSLEGLEFPPPAERLVTSALPGWPPGSLVEPLPLDLAQQLQSELVLTLPEKEPEVEVKAEPEKPPRRVPARRPPAPVLGPRSSVRRRAPKARAWTRPDGTRSLEYTIYRAMGESSVGVALRDEAGEALLSLGSEEEALQAAPGRVGRVFVTNERGHLFLRDMNTGDRLRELGDYDCCVFGPRERYLLYCRSGQATLLNLETGTETQFKARFGAFDQAGERIVCVADDLTTLSVRRVEAPRADWELSLEWYVSFVQQIAPAFFSTCGEFVGIRDEQYTEAPNRGFRADTGAPASLEGVEFPPVIERLATKSCPDWPPDAHLELWP